MLKAIKLKLYLNKEQTNYVSDLLGSYRFVYNNCLNLKKNKYENEKLSIGLKDLGKYFHNELTKNEDNYWLNKHNTKVLKQSIINLLDAYKNFFNKNENGFPKYKSRKDNKLSCRFPVESISKRNDYLTSKLTLTKYLKDIKFRCSDKDKKYLNKYKNNIKSATLTKTKSGNYFLSILIDSFELKQLPKTDKVIGLDLGIKDFIVTSDKTSFDNLKLKRTNQNKLNKLHRILSKKEKGSKNKDKARVKLAKYYDKLNNKKENYLHNVVNQLLNDNQVIVIEDLNVKGMMKNHNLARSIQELSLYRFKQILTYKSEWYGRDLIKIDRFYPSSKLCSSCGNKNDELTLKDRTWLCSACNTTHDRDYNASLNIKNEGLRLYNEIIPTRSGDFKPIGDGALAPSLN